MVKSCLAIAAAALGMVGTTGCASTLVEPGHRGLYFAPNEGGLKREVLQPGKYKLGFCFLYCTPNRIDDFDVTYSTKSEEIETKSSEGLDLHLKLSVIYRPIESEIYQLDTEIGPAYYDEVVGPEFRSACRGVFARHSYRDLHTRNETLENEVETEVRRRIGGHHIEISSVTLEQVTYAPEIAEKDRQRIAAEVEKERQLAAIESEKQRGAAMAEKQKLATESAAQQKTLEIETQAKEKALELTTGAAQQKLELTTQAANDKFRAEQQLASLDTQRKAAKATLEIERLHAEASAQSKILEARGEAEAARQMAGAHAAERRAETAGVTPMEVMIHAYDALAHLGGTGTTIVLGDWAHVPNFLFPRVPSLQAAFGLPYSPYGMPGMGAPAGKPGGNILSSTAKPDEQ